jgi:hypothetical protein
VTFLNMSAYPTDELTTLRVRMPIECLMAIDDAIEIVYPALDREEFIFMAIRYALSSVGEESTEWLMDEEDD